jgi:hypothetical protein
MLAPELRNCGSLLLIDVAAVLALLAVPSLEAKLKPQLLILSPLLRLSTSERRFSRGFEEAVGTAARMGKEEDDSEAAEKWMAGTEVSRGVSGYETGGTSQCARKCSPRTELYGLQILPFCQKKKKKQSFERHVQRDEGETHDELEFFGK